MTPMPPHAMADASHRPHTAGSATPLRLWNRRS